MIELNLEALAQSLGGELSEPVSICGMVLDSRQIKPNDLFVAVEGDRVDGHDYLATARQAGASAALVTKWVDDPIPQWKVDDIVWSMGKVGEAFRQAFSGTVIAITGSSGKTTTRSLMQGICSQAGSSMATIGNLNNHFGCPLTLARLDDQEFAVIEMGASGPNEIDWMCELAHPHAAILTNAGAAHLEGFGSLEGVRQAKGEIFDRLPESGVAALNRDDVGYEAWLKRAPCQTISFGEHPEADIRLLGYGLDQAGLSRLSIQVKGESKELVLQLPGLHSALDACAALAIAVGLEIPFDTAAKGLASVEPISGRLCPRQITPNILALDDTYNANPASVKAGIDVLMSGEEASCILVMGHMAELGEGSENGHREVGEYAAQKKVNHVLVVGEEAQPVAEAAGEAACFFVSKAELVDKLEALVRAADNARLLCKGSRSAAMETVLEELIKRVGNPC